MAEKDIADHLSMVERLHGERQRRDRLVDAVRERQRADREVQKAIEELNRYEAETEKMAGEATEDVGPRVRPV